MSISMPSTGKSMRERSGSPASPHAATWSMAPMPSMPSMPSNCTGGAAAAAAAADRTSSTPRANRIAGPGLGAASRCRTLRPGYSHAMRRCEHRRQAGTAKSQRRLALMHAAHDLRRGGGLSRSRAVSDMFHAVLLPCQGRRPRASSAQGCGHAVRAGAGGR